MAKNETTQDPVPVLELVKDIRENLSQKSASRQDEITVMQSMLSDPSYEVNVWGKTGIKATYNPCKDYRSMGATMLVNTTKITQHEANALMEGYIPTKRECESMINIGKEFTNTYLQTERKLPFGGRDTIDASLQIRHVEATERTYPSRDSNGNTIRVSRQVPAHDVVKVKNAVRKGE